MNVLYFIFTAFAKRIGKDGQDRDQIFHYEMTLDERALYMFTCIGKKIYILLFFPLKDALRLQEDLDSFFFDNYFSPSLQPLPRQG